MVTSPNILVIGGSGIVGRIIAASLAELLPNAVVTTASRRRIPDSDQSGRLRHLEIDASQPESLRSALVGRDLAIIAMGPFDRYGASIHRICIEAGVDIVDINDSIAATREIIAAAPHACARGVRILTGMGLAPGLSTLLLFKLARSGKFASDDYLLRLYMGALNVGGPTSAAILLNGFVDRLPALVDGEQIMAGGLWTGRLSTYRFPGGGGAVRLLPFASPEVETLTRDGEAGRLGVRSLDWRYHVQFLPAGFAHALAVSGAIRSHPIFGALSQMFHRSGERMRRKKDADDTTTLVVARADGSDALVVHGPVATSHLTAMTAVGASLHLIGLGRALAPGVYSLERLLAQDPAVESTLDDLLTRRGVVVTKPFLDAAAAHRAVFGDSATFDGTAQSLQHFGKCWYTAGAIPPRVKRYQQTCLRRSSFWRSVCERTSRLSRLLLMARVGRRRFRLLRQTRQDFGIRADVGTRRIILADFSLFAAGYREARALLGAEALPLYSEMFLDSGAMEMAWLWPSERVFASSDRPIEVLSTYVEAYVQACVELGVTRASCSADESGFRVDFEHCTYARMLAAFEAPELGGLVREMEVRAIRGLASACGLETVWMPGPTEGVGRLVLRKTDGAGGPALVEEEAAG